MLPSSPMHCCFPVFPNPIPYVTKQGVPVPSFPDFAHNFTISWFNWNLACVIWEFLKNQIVHQLFQRLLYPSYLLVILIWNSSISYNYVSWLSQPYKGTGRQGNRSYISIPWAILSSVNMALVELIPSAMKLWKWIILFSIAADGLLQPLAKAHFHQFQLVNIGGRPNDFNKFLEYLK
jgi:hypothetical protein